MFEYGFVENVDYLTVAQKCATANNGYTMKNELFNLIEATSGDLCVLGSELHEFLEVKTPYKKWIERMFEYGFVENVDYLTIGQKCPIANGGYKMKTNHYIKMDMAKEISMIQRNEKGKQARQFYSRCKLLLFF